MSSNPDLLAAIPERCEADLIGLSRIHDPDSEGWTRTVFSDPYRESREWIRARMIDVGLEVHPDGAGNLVGVLPGRNPAASPLVTGSHTDTVRGGGRFDGAVGVLGALEAVRLLREHDLQLDRDLLVIDFLGEESNEFGLSCMGSRALAGELSAADLDRQDHHGTRLGDRYAAFGIDPSGVLASSGWAKTRALHRYVELHVEQGPLLEESGVPIGVVTAIAGIERILATFTGRPDHAGTMPMGDRRDALVAAAEAVLAVRQEGCGAPVHGVATTSQLVSEPGSPNVVPGRVRMQAEMRSVDPGWLSEAQRRLTEKITLQASAYGVDVDFEWSHDNECRPASPSVHQTISSAVDSLGIAWEPVPSGATHDAVHMARLCPMGMIFVPSQGGRSHCPEEWSELDHIATGVQVLAMTLVELDRTTD
ncbi:M20 family metallo-hydrolase [Amycolatopsis jejuensis]|uniref:M20 family metallo-hydrolase n=1 Tax=Amycolatopsis jejuensis TaxID=330084 RepID=UPI000ACD5680|nr:M20 family metallo-hydrolase [Amycolatopsis jejuensis]